MSEKIKKVIAPVRIDFGGGTTDIKPFAKKYGGCVLNAAIDKYIEGELYGGSDEVGLEYHGNIPTSSGLGTSGAMNLVWLALIAQKDKITDNFKKELAERGYRIEQAMGLIGGKQDQYASAFGGINLWTFGDGKAKKRKVNVNKGTIKELEKNLIIVYMGEHYSGDSNQRVIENFKKGKNIEELKNVKEVAKDMKKALERGDLDDFAELMNKETENRKKLHKSIVPKKLDKIIKKGLKVAEGAKVLGAGGGGSILFYGNKKKLKKKFKNTIEFKFDWEGLRKI